MGASTIARQAMVEAIRRQPPAPGSTTVAGTQLIGLYSQNVQRGQAFAEALQIAHVFASAQDLLSRTDVHCIYISSYPRLHKEMALAALEAGKHVLCETPLALTVDDAQEVATSAARRGLLLGINHALRFEPALSRMRQLLRAYAIGDVLGGRISNTELLPFALHTWRLRPNGGGVILDRTIHDVDLVRWLLDDEVAQVSALASRQTLGTAVEDDVVVNLQLVKSGVLVQTHDSFVVPHQSSSVEIYGTSGTLIAYNCLGLQPAGDLMLVRNDRAQVISLERRDPYAATIRAFNQAVRAHRDGQRGAGSPQPGHWATPRDGLRNLQVALAARQAAQSGWTIPLND